MSRVVLIAALAATSLLIQQYATTGVAAARQKSAGEVRALWVQRGSLTSPESIRKVVDTAKAAGFNTLLVQVRGRGDAYYNSRYEPRASLLVNQPASFDPLDFTLAAARRAGLQLHVWVNVNLIADASLPQMRSHLVRSHPEWLMVPRSLAGELARMRPKDPDYVARLAGYARSHSDRVEGVFLSPVGTAAVAHTVRVIGDIASRYPVDGIHLDYLRFPNEEFDYSDHTLEEFRSEVLSSVSANERREYSSRARGRPLFYTEMFPQRWQQFRRARLTELLGQIRKTVRARRPRAILSAAVFPDPDDAANYRFQDWRRWLAEGLLDAICPMSYTTDQSLFRAQVANVKRAAGGRPVWAGVGAFQLPAGATIEHIRIARGLGAEGTILFSYDNLNSQYVETVANGAFR